MMASCRRYFQHMVLVLCAYIAVLTFSDAPFAAANQIKGLDDSILFRLGWRGSDKTLLESPDYEKLLMTTANNEQYHCLVPIHYGEDKDDTKHYMGPSAFSLLMPLFKKQTCSLRMESYWTYKICHGLSITQYHEEREGKATQLQEYNLGQTSYEDLKWALKQYEEELQGNHNPVIPTTKIEGVTIPYFMVNYTDGTICDLTGKPRVSHVLYTCYEDGQHDVFSIKETYTCEYEIVVLSHLLCQHPAFRPRDIPQTDLHCIPVSGSPKQPRAHVHAEAESLKLRMHGALLGGNAMSGTVKLEVLDEAEEELDSPPPAAQKQPTLTPPQPIFDHKLVQDFLNGEHCLIGGSGWWKYEFCYGRKVDQYHEDRDGTKTIIRLGSFDVKNHLEWLNKHPGKKYKRGKKQVSHFYSNGAFCEDTNKPRQIEVKLKCKESNSPNSVALYLLEPVTCEYILGVESSIICPLLAHADDVGLFTLAEPWDGKEDRDQDRDKMESIISLIREKSSSEAASTQVIQEVTATGEVTKVIIEEEVMEEVEEEKIEDKEEKHIHNVKP